MTSTNKKKPISMDDNKTLDLLLDSTASLNCEKSSDDDIKKLLKKMENLLSPNDHSVFDSNGNKSVGDILKAADELIHSTSPLFEALSPIGSQHSSGNSQNISSKSFKIDIPQLPLYNKSCSLSSNHEISNINNTNSGTGDVTKQNNTTAANIITNISKGQLTCGTGDVTKQNNTTAANINTNISKGQLTLNIENKLTPDVKNAESIEEKPTTIVNEPVNINKEFHFQDIGNVGPLKKNISSSSKSHTKFDKHRQLNINIKPDVDKKVKTSQVISKHKPENSRMKTSSSDTKIKQNKRGESKKDLNNRDNTDQANHTPNDDNNSNMNEKSKINIQNTNDSNSEAFSFQKLQSFSLDNLLLKSNKETENDLPSDIHSLTRTLSPTEEERLGVRNNISTIHDKELKMSDLVTPSHGTLSLEQELEIQRNKVRQLKEELNATVRAHLQQMEFLKISHEEEMVMMKRQMKIEQETELKKRLLSQTPGLDKATTPLDDHLLSSYDKENKRLCQEVKVLKTEFRDAENKWLEEKSKLILQLDQDETDSLKKQLKEARMKISSLEQTIHLFKVKEEDGSVDSNDVIQKLEHQNFQLMNEICELTKKINDSNLKAADIVQSKDEEIVRLTNELRNRNALSIQEEANAIKELKAQLNEEKAQLKSVLDEKEILGKDNYDLRRQVKELEIIVKKRNTTGCLTITGQEFFPETEKIKQLESQLSDKEKLIEKLTENVDAIEKKFKGHIKTLESQMKNETEKVKIEAEKLRKLKTAHVKELEEVKKATKKTNTKDDAHLLATIRGLQSELLNKEKLMSKMNKELDDVKKTNKTLQKERERILSSKNDSKHSSTQSLKNVGAPQLPSPDHSAEMVKLKQRVKELEEDMVTLHEKATHDMELLKEQHNVELTAAKGSQGNIAELEGQIYTQEIIITHLKQKLGQLEALQNSHTLLKLENEKLEKHLTEANTRITKLSEPQDASCSSSSNQTVLSKIDYLEKRHEVREKTLQAIIHELLSDKKVSTQCMGDCHTKLLDKNREICYYRAEMDRILDSLRQYKQNH